MNLTINGTAIPVQGVRALRPGISIEQASQKTKGNGLDEVYFNSNGKSYVAYGDSLNISMLKKNVIPAVMLNGQKADIVAFEDEANSVWEGMKKGSMEALRDTGGAVIGAMRNVITTVGPGSIGVAGAGLAGYSIYQIWRGGQGVGASLAAASAAPGVGKSILDLLGTATIGAVKLIAVTGAVGAGVTAAYGAVKGAMEAKVATKDYTSIASVTEDGAAPSNGGTALQYHQSNNPLPGGFMGSPVPGQGYGINIQITPSAQIGTVGSLMSPGQLQALTK